MPVKHPKEKISTYGFIDFISLIKPAFVSSSCLSPLLVIGMSCPADNSNPGTPEDLTRSLLLAQEFNLLFLYNFQENYDNSNSLWSLCVNLEIIILI